MKGKLLVAACIIFCTSCTHYYYAPNSQNVSLFKTKHELIAQVGSNTDGSTECRAAFSVTDHLAIGYNYFSIEDDWTTDVFALMPGYTSYSYPEYSKGHLHDFFAGYYKQVGKEFTFVTLGGISTGNVKNLYEYGHSKFDIRRIFVQPTFGYRDNIFEAALSCRFARLQYTDPQITGYYDLSEEPSYDLFYVKNNPVQYVAEPAFTFSVGYKFIKLQGQYGRSFNLTSSQFKQVDSYLSACISINLHPDIFRRNKKEK